MEVIYQSHPEITIATNVFRNCKVILQFEQTPLLEVVKSIQAGYTVRFPVFSKDGVQIATVDGARIHLTPEGKNANIQMRYPQNMTVCELDGKPILEMHRIGAAALKGWAELYTPEGILLKATDSGVSGLLRGGDFLRIGSNFFQGNTVDGCKIGILVRNNEISFGVNG